MGVSGAKAGVTAMPAQTMPWRAEGESVSGFGSGSNQTSVVSVLSLSGSQAEARWQERQVCRTCWSHRVIFGSYLAFGRCLKSKEIHYFVLHTWQGDATWYSEGSDCGFFKVFSLCGTELVESVESYHMTSYQVSVHQIISFSFGLALWRCQEGERPERPWVTPRRRAWTPGPWRSRRSKGTRPRRSRRSRSRRSRRSWSRRSEEEVRYMYN